MCSCLCTVLAVSVLYFKKKHWNRLRENSKIRHFVISSHLFYWHANHISDTYKYILFCLCHFPNYRTRAIITRGLYLFNLIFHCGLYCRAVYIAERLVFSSIFFQVGWTILTVIFIFKSKLIHKNNIEVSVTIFTKIERTLFYRTLKALLNSFAAKLKKYCLVLLSHLISY